MKAESHRVFGFIAFFAVFAQLLLAQEPYKAPEGIPPQSDFVYRKHYEEVTQIMQLPDLAQREKQLETYMNKLHPKSKILQYMENFFGQIVKDYQAAGKNAEAKALSQKMAKWFPSSDAALPQQFQSAFDSKDYNTAIPLGEKLLAKNPDDAQILVMLAQSYLATNNTAKMLSVSPKVVQALGPKKGVYYVAWLGDYYRGQRDTAKAAQYYGMLLDAYPSGMPQGWETARWNALKANAHMVRATNAYLNKNFEAATQDYYQSLQYAPKNDAAYLYMGLSFWKISSGLEDPARLEQLNQAITSFARAVALNGPNKAKAQQYLEQVYKPLNNNTLDGLDKVLERAESYVASR
jgi:tetratricopeptide (TPR) repeat protein